MKKIIPNQYISESELKYKDTYTDEELHSTLYMTPFPTDDNVYDYDGLKEWYYSWNSNDELFHDTPFEEYINSEIWRTVSPVSVPAYIWKQYNETREDE